MAQPNRSHDDLPALAALVTTFLAVAFFGAGTLVITATFFTPDFLAVAAVVVFVLVFAAGFLAAPPPDPN